MRAYVIYEAGGPEKLEFNEVALPSAKAGWVLIKIHAFGLNRSEWFTRKGDSPSVKFPRILGIECVGEVIEAPGSDLKPGDKVAAMMGGMGRDFDGSYAEYTSVPRDNVFKLNTSLPWDKLAALPEMLQTVRGSLVVGLEVKAGDRLLIRGGTSSIGYASIALGKAMGLDITATSRDPNKRDSLIEAGASKVLIDNGNLSHIINSGEVEKFDCILELIGAKTLLDSLQCARTGGVVCMTGILGGTWELDGFLPMEHIPTGVKLTAYSGGSTDITEQELQNYVTLIESGKLNIRTGPVFLFSQLVEAHRLMDANQANGKIVITIS